LHSSLFEVFAVMDFELWRTKTAFAGKVNFGGKKLYLAGKGQICRDKTDN